MMKRMTIVFIGLFLLFTAGCGDGGEEPSSSMQHPPTDDEISESEIAKVDEQLKEAVEKQPASMEEKTDDINVSNREEPVEGMEENLLDAYSTEEIEYARIWRQLGPNQEIDELYVKYIQEGEPINPHIGSSARYPEDVIQLAGSRLVDGSVTYSGNGDGTINVYYVPLRWEAATPKDFDEEDMRIYTESIIENTELIPIEPWEDEQVLRLIEKINIGSSSL